MGRFRGDMEVWGRHRACPQPQHCPLLVFWAGVPQIEKSALPAPQECRGCVGRTVGRMALGPWRELCCCFFSLWGLPPPGRGHQAPPSPSLGPPLLHTYTRGHRAWADSHTLLGLMERQAQGSDGTGAGAHWWVRGGGHVQVARFPLSFPGGGRGARVSRACLDGLQLRRAPVCRLLSHQEPAARGGGRPAAAHPHHLVAPPPRQGGGCPGWRV